MTTIAVVFQSAKGAYAALAEAVQKGVQQVPDVCGRIFEIAGKDVHEIRRDQKEPIP
jgi:hypothetical protein